MGRLNAGLRVTSLRQPRIHHDDLPPASSLTRAPAPVEYQRQHEDDDAEADGSIRQVEVGRPEVDLDEVDNAPEAHAVDEVADGAAGHRPQRHGAEHAGCTA